MEREKVACVVYKHVGSVLSDLKLSEIDMSQSMKELGATSLDIVEVVSLSMRELNVKVPRSELNKLTNIDGLIDLLHASTREKVQAASAT